MKISIGYILILIFVLSGYDYRLSQFMIPEIMLVLLFIITLIRKGRFHNVLFTMAGVLIFLFLINGFFDSLSGAVRVVEFYAFLYKYAFILMTIFMFYSTSISEGMWRTSALTLAIFWLVWIGTQYMDQSVATLFSGVAYPRPYSIDVSADSHLFGFLIGIVFLLVHQSSTRQSAKLIVIICGLITSLLVGARTPIAVMLTAMIIIMLVDVSRKPMGKKILQLISVMIVGCFATLVVLKYDLYYTFRAISFKLDGSVLGRFDKFYLVLESSLRNIPFGFSRLSFEGRWVDGLLTTLILDFGIIFGPFIIFTLLIMLAFIIWRLLGKSLNVTCIALLYIFGGLLVTEYLLTARGSIIAIGSLFGILTLERKNAKHRM